jgi:hypothetical protein
MWGEIDRWVSVFAYGRYVNGNVRAIGGRIGGVLKFGCVEPLATVRIEALPVLSRQDR